ncbi:cyclase family protein [Paracoccus sp. (in: a-proteobacteria)]|uniref:cyclase family protein n=1 Tax=Paracoccus sp. TaxID=267 RepID=UPI003A841A17
MRRGCAGTNAKTGRCDDAAYRGFVGGHVVTAADVQAELRRIGHDLQPGDIVLVNTAAGARHGLYRFRPAGKTRGRLGRVVPGGGDLR